MQYNYDTIYHFDFTGKVQFGDLPINLVYELFRDGRVISKFLEHTVPVWFPDLNYVDEKGYDHVSKTTGIKFDLKGFTKGGASYAPSSMLGAGRKIDKKTLHEHAATISYIISDVTEFPKVRIIFKRGHELVEKYPSGKIPKDHKNILFS